MAIIGMHALMYSKQDEATRRFFRGTGKAVRISGYEESTLSREGLIAESKGHYDEAEYQRQVTAGAPTTSSGA